MTDEELRDAYSRIYMLGRMDERDHSTDLCKNPRSICIRCDRRSSCEYSDTGAYIGECKDFIYAGTEDNIPQWHYPSKGELPEDYRLILLCYKNGDAKLGYYDEVFADWKNKYDEPVAYPYAWQYIEPPKEV